jgi:hypothetical protein
MGTNFADNNLQEATTVEYRVIDLDYNFNIPSKKKSGVYCKVCAKIFFTLRLLNTKSSIKIITPVFGAEKVQFTAKGAQNFFPKYRSNKQYIRLEPTP